MRVPAGSLFALFQRLEIPDVIRILVGHDNIIPWPMNEHEVIF